MPPDPLPSAVRDAARLRALDSYAILDTPPEQRFDDIAQLAGLLCGTPVALVSLVAGERQWFKARVGFPLCETDLDSSVCAHTLAEPDVLVIPDLTADPRTSGNPLVTAEPFIRFYAGAPLLLADGRVLGSLCVIDHVPRTEGLSEPQRDGLRRLARQVVDLIGLREAVSRRDAVLAHQDAGLRREHRLELLAEASALLLTAPNPAGALLARLEAEVAGLGFEQSFAYTITPDGRHLALTRAIGADQATKDALERVAFDVPLCGIVADCGEPLVLDRLQQTADPRYEIARQTGVDAYAGYPITSRGRTRGVISFASTRAATFDPEALDFFATIVRLLSLAQERQDDEQALRAGAERLDLTFRASATVGWWDWGVQADRLITNAPFAALIGADPALLARGAGVDAFWRAVHPDDLARVRDLVAQAMSTAGPYHAEYRLVQPGGGERWVVASGHCYNDEHGRPGRFPGILIDVTEAKQAVQRQAVLTELGDRLRDLSTKSEISFAAAEIVGKHLGLSRAGYGTVNPEQETVEVERDWALPGLNSIAGRHSFRTYGDHVDDLKRGVTVAIDDVRRDPRTAPMAENLLALQGAALFNQPIMERGRFVGLLFAGVDRPHAWTEAEIGFMRKVADRTRAAIGRAEAEAQQELLNGELSHRLKNTLAMVQSIATQTLRGVADRAPVDAFERRVHALASAHNVLVKRSWTAAPLADVALGVLENSGLQDRVTVEGPAVRLGARAALSMSLVLHELTTNAGKYGALSAPEGRVDLTWAVEGTGPDAEVAMLWRERGGPPVREPTRKGFGSRLIRLGMVGAGGVELRYPGEGFQAAMRASLRELQQS